MGGDPNELMHIPLLVGAFSLRALIPKLDTPPHSPTTSLHSPLPSLISHSPSLHSTTPTTSSTHLPPHSCATPLSSCASPLLPMRPYFGVFTKTCIKEGRPFSCQLVRVLEENAIIVVSIFCYQWNKGFGGLIWCSMLMCGCGLSN
jgi:hypothetical protein